MAKINLKAKLMQLSHLELFFTDLTASKDRDGKSIAILQLETPIPLVRGSQEVEWNGKNRPIVAKDVVEVKVHEEDMNDGFEFDEENGTNAGKYSGSDLVLDVAKNGTVWMKRTTFASSANTMRAGFRNERLAKVFGEPIKAPEAPATPVTGTKPVEVPEKGATKGK